MTGGTSPLFSLLATPLKKVTSAFEGGHRLTSDGSVTYRQKDWPRRVTEKRYWMRTRGRDAGQALSVEV